MNLDLAEFALKQAMKHAKYAEVRLEESSGNSFLLKNGILESAGFEHSLGLSLRMVVNGASCFSSLNNVTKERIKRLVQEARKARSRINRKLDLSEERVHKDKYKVKQKMNLKDVSAEEKLGLLTDVEKSITGTKVDVPGRHFFFSDAIIKRYFMSSEGASIQSSIPRSNFYYYITVKAGEKLAQRYWSYGATGGFEEVKAWKLPQVLLEEVNATKQNLTKGIKPPSGKIDVVVAPQVTGIIVHESTGHPYEADRILGREAAQAGESFITPEMLGKSIGSDVVNVVDDPTLSNSYGFYLYDDEGVKARRKHLIKDGVITEFLHNRETAKQFNLKSNAGARANAYNREAIVRMSNTFMLPGSFTEEELIEGVKKGVYIKNFMEWNIDDKRFNQKYIGAESYLIKNGKLGEPVTNPTLEITTPKLYSSIDGVAKNIEHHAGNCGKGEPMQGIPVWFGGPSFRMRGLELSK
jgi:TldD protein